jgi:hypothetical protein
MDKIPIHETAYLKSKNFENVKSSSQSEKIKITRRNFLKKTALITSALAVDSLLPQKTSDSEGLAKIVNKLNADKNDENELAEVRAKIRESIEPSPEMQALAHEIQIRTRQLLKNDDFFPQKLFSDNFLTAVQIQESGLKRDAESEAGAIGIMQVRPITIKEVFRYLHILKNKDLIEFEGPKIQELSDENISDIINIIKKNGDLGRAFGKLYFAELLNNFEIGKKDFTQGSITKARKKILAAYNWNPTSLKKNENNESAWPNESREYYVKILNNIDRLKIIQKEIIKRKMKTDTNMLSALLTIELNKYPDIDNDDTFFVKITNNYLENIHGIENITERPLKEKEIQARINAFNPGSFRLYANNKNANDRR